MVQPSLIQYRALLNGKKKNGGEDGIMHQVNQKLGKFLCERENPSRAVDDERIAQRDHER